MSAASPTASEMKDGKARLVALQIIKQPGISARVLQRWSGATWALGEMTAAD